MTKKIVEKEVPLLTEEGINAVKDKDIKEVGKKLREVYEKALNK